jgi:hypothetical protein
MESWIFPALAVVGSFVGALFGSHISKRGGIRAIHAELDKVVKQNEAITRATEQIKQELSKEAWIRDVKKTVAFDIVRALMRVNNTLTEMEKPLLTDTLTPDKAIALSKDFHNATWEAKATYVNAAIVCGKPIRGAIETSVKPALKTIAYDLMQGVTGATLRAHFVDYQKAVQELVELLRADLGIG